MNAAMNTHSPHEGPETAAQVATPKGEAECERGKRLHRESNTERLPPTCQCGRHSGHACRDAGRCGTRPLRSSSTRKLAPRDRRSRHVDRRGSWSADDSGGDGTADCLELESE